MADPVAVWGAEDHYPRHAQPIGKETTHKARTSHVCDACLGTIQPGDTYTRQPFKDTDEPITVLRRHTTCPPIP